MISVYCMISLSFLPLPVMMTLDLELGKQRSAEPRKETVSFWPLDDHDSDGDVIYLPDYSECSISDRSVRGVRVGCYWCDDGSIHRDS